MSDTQGTLAALSPRTLRLLRCLGVAVSLLIAALIILAFALGVATQAFISTWIIRHKPNRALALSDVKHWAPIGERSKHYTPRRSL